MVIALDKIEGSYALASGVGEVTAISFTPTQNVIVKGIWLDLAALTQNITIRVKYRIDGTNLREFQSNVWQTIQSDGVLIDGDLPVDALLSVTLQSAVAEGAVRSIPYQIFYEGIGAGAVTFTYTLTNSVTGIAIGGAELWVTTDAPGANVVASGLTNSAGQAVFYLTAGTYYVWRRHNDYTFSNPDMEIVSA